MPILPFSFSPPLRPTTLTVISLLGPLRNKVDGGVDGVSEGPDHADRDQHAGPLRRFRMIAVIVKMVVSLLRTLEKKWDDCGHGGDAGNGVVYNGSSDHADMR